MRKETNFSPNRWTQRPDPDGLLYILFHSKGFANTTGYKNERVDELLEQAPQNFDQAERKKLYGEVQAIIVQRYPDAAAVLLGRVRGAARQRAGLRVDPGPDPAFPRPLEEEVTEGSSGRWRPR